MAGPEGRLRGIAPRELGVVLPSEQATERRITPELLLLDNRSENSVRIRKQWNIWRADGTLTLEWDCDDARRRPPLKAVQVRTISIGGDEETYEAYEGLANDKSIERIAAVTHYDGETVKNGVVPTGCGGQDAKGKQKTNQAPTEGGVYDWVREKIAHDDPVVQAIISAARISRWTTKPVLAAICNHLTGEIFPLAIFQQGKNGETNIHSSVNLGDILDGSYRPEKIYERGIPHLDITDPLLEAYATYFAENQHEVATLADKYLDLRNRMKVQNPDAIVISTQTRPLRTRYYDTFGDPGVAFEITAARCRKSIEAPTRITKSTIDEILQQLDYAMKHSLNPKGRDFRNTRTILVETTHLEESRRIAQAIAKTDLGITWLAEGRSIIIAEVRAGEIADNKIEYFKPAA